MNIRHALSAALLLVAASAANAGYLGTPVFTTCTTAVNNTATIPQDGTVPQNTEGTAYACLDTTYTPTSATSLLEIEVFIPITVTNASNGSTLALFRDSGANAIAASSGTNSGSAYRLGGVMLKVFVTAGSTSATTFKLRYGPTGGTMWFNSETSGNVWGAAQVAFMSVKEIAQ
jgi:hypothetical protein